MARKYKIPDYDVFGYCVKCGKRMINHAVIDGIYKIRLTGDYTTVTYKLNDGSQMRVAMCRHCSERLTGDVSENNMIMLKVWRGWQNEVETYANWSEDKKKKYLDKYSMLRIVTKSDGLADDSVDRIFSDYKKNEDKQIGHIKESVHGNSK